MMKITNIRIRKNTSQESELLGIASILLDECLVIHNIKLLQLQDKRVVSFPNIRKQSFSRIENGYEEKYEYKDIVHPATTEFRKYIEDEIFKVYDLQV